MSYKYNGSMIQIAHPVQSISVNKQRVIFSDTQGLKNAMFQKAEIFGIFTIDSFLFGLGVIVFILLVASLFITNSPRVR